MCHLSSLVFVMLCCLCMCVQAVRPLMTENDLDKETEKTMFHLVASLLLVSTAVEIDTSFVVDDVSINMMTTAQC